MILLVIDMQKALIDDELYAFDTFMERTARLIDAARPVPAAGSPSGMKPLKLPKRLLPVKVKKSSSKPSTAASATRISKNIWSSLTTSA